MQTDEASRARLATSADAAELVRLRALMFESMGVSAADPRWRSACLSFLEVNLGNSLLIGAVVDAPDGSGLASGGLANLMVRTPSPSSPTGTLAYLSSMSTDPRWQRMGYGRAVIVRLLQELEGAGIAQAELHATSAGERLYRSLGFAERPGGLEMRIDVGPRRS